MTDATISHLESGRYLRSTGDNYRPLTKEWVEHSIPDRFLRQVVDSPDRTAVKTKHGVLTYQALNIFSNRIANAIIRQGQPGQEAVCLLLEHDADVPAAIFGILKSGKFYFALDSSHPRDRNEFLLKDAEASLIVTNNRNLALAESLVSNHSRLINIDALKTGALDHDPDVRIGPDNIASLVYTSGSTGEPKGVIHTHRSLLHSALRQVNAWRLCSGDRVGLFFTYNFGASTSNLFGALLSGASLYPFDIKKEPPARLLEWLNEEEITFFHTVPTVFRHLVSTMNGRESFPKLRLMRLAGETIYGNDVKLFQEHFGGDCVLQVGMGSTETGAVLQSFYDLQSVCPDGAIPPGYPTEDMQVLLTNDTGHVAGPGEVGEIAVRSRYMFSGYWHKPELTAQALLPDPDGGEERTYFMRDLGSRLPDGRIMHLGRKDAQVKIRGHRVEMGEVELALLDVSGIAEAAVIAKEASAGEKQLIAYVARDDSASMPTNSLRSLLKQNLPDYMIPAAFVPLEALPLTVSGKIDRAALSARPLLVLDREFAAPRDFVEVQLLAVWEELLRTEGFGIRDDFFELGGDSLLAMQLTLRIEELIGREVNLANFPTEVTIEKLADTLVASEQENLQHPILAIQTTGTASPLFFVHGDFVSGGAFCRNLARHLGPDQPFYAIPPHGLDGGLFPQTIEAMAADRVTALRTFQPEGPYRLGGFCWGGNIALEMARRLQAQGSQVEPLLLIDSDPKNIELRPLRRFIRHLRSWFSLREETELFLFGWCRRFYGAWSKADGVAERCRSLLAKSLRIFAKLFRVTGNSNATQSGIGLFDASIIPENRHSRWPIYHTINQNYVAEPYSGKVVLFRSSRLQERYPDDPKAAWRHISADIETRSIAGDHRSCVTKHVADVALKMSAHLSSHSHRD